MSARSFVLPDVIDLVAVRPLHKALLDLRGDDLVIDAGAVQRINGLGLQVIASAEATWARDERRFDISNASPAFAEAVRLAGA